MAILLIMSDFLTKCFVYVDEEGDDLDINEDEEDDECVSCGHEKDNCQCQVLLEKFISLNYTFAELGLIEHVANPAIVTVVYEQV